MKKASKVITVIVFLFLYIPIFLLLIASFNSGTDIAVFKSFTFDQYAELFKDGDLLSLALNSVIIAVASTVLATVLGTMAAVGIYGMRSRIRSLVMGMTNIPMTNPDIVTGVSLALVFVFAGSLMKVNSILGFWTLLIAHITFNLPYVIMNVIPRLHAMNPSLTEAALDLGCRPVQAFFKVTLPQIMPGVIAGALMSFTMSLDDFVISYFVTGSNFVTLPVEIYNYTKKPIHPKLYALFVLMFILILALMIVMNIIQGRGEKVKTHRREND